MKLKVGARRCAWGMKRGRQCTREARNWFAVDIWLCGQHFQMALKQSGETYERYIAPRWQVRA